MVDPFDDHQNRALTDHVEDFLATLRGVEKHVKGRRRFLGDYLAATRATRLSDLDAVAAEYWLTSLEQSGLSARSINGRSKALRQFGRWLHENRRWPFNPFVGLSLRSESQDRRHERRALTPVEVSRLLLAARSRPFESGRGVHRGATLTQAIVARLFRIGNARAIVYLPAVGTGLRRRELAMLRWCDVDFESQRITVTVETQYGARLPAALDPEHERLRPPSLEYLKKGARHLRVAALVALETVEEPTREEYEAVKEVRVRRTSALERNLSRKILAEPGWKPPPLVLDGQRPDRR